MSYLAISILFIFSIYLYRFVSRFVRWFMRTRLYPYAILTTVYLGSGFLIAMIGKKIGEILGHVSL